MKHTFTICIEGHGEDREKAWLDACDCLACNPSSPPEIDNCHEELVEACEYTIEKMRGIKGKTFSILPILQALAKARS